MMSYSTPTPSQVTCTNDGTGSQFLPLVHKGEFSIHVVPGDELSASVWSHQVAAVWSARHLETTYAHQTAVCAWVLVRVPVHLDTCDQKWHMSWYLPATYNTMPHKKLTPCCMNYELFNKLKPRLFSSYIYIYMFLLVKSHLNTYSAPLKFNF